MVKYKERTMGAQYDNVEKSRDLGRSITRSGSESGEQSRVQVRIEISRTAGDGRRFHAIAQLVSLFLIG